MRDAKAESLIEASCRINFHDAKRQDPDRRWWPTESDDPSPRFQCLALEGWVDEELRKKERAVLRTALQPTDIDTIKGDDPTSHR